MRSNPHSVPERRVKSFLFQDRNANSVRSGKLNQNLLRGDLTKTSIKSNTLTYLLPSYSSSYPKLSFIRFSIYTCTFGHFFLVGTSCPGRNTVVLAKMTRKKPLSTKKYAEMGFGYRGSEYDVSFGVAHLNGDVYASDPETL